MSNIDSQGRLYSSVRDTFVIFDRPSLAEWIANKRQIPDTEII